MKHYTTPGQTAKLIELGLPKPRYYCTNKYTIIHTGFDIINYSIGELIEMLPRCIESENGSDEAVLEISYDSQDFVWFCGHRWYYNRGWRLFGEDYKTIDDTELVDALYRYIVELKVEGVI